MKADEKRRVWGTGVFALGMCVAAIGSQTGGSINRPASFCGIAGLKPSLAGAGPGCAAKAVRTSRSA